MLGLRKGLDLVKYEMNKQPANDAIHRFHDSAVHQVARIAEAFHRMEADYEKLCAQFGENYKSTESDDVFKPLLDFVKAFQVGAGAGVYSQTSPLIFSNTTHVRVHVHLPVCSVCNAIKLSAKIVESGAGERCS